MAEYIRFSGQDKEGTRAPCNVLCIQISGCVLVQGETTTKEEAYGECWHCCKARVVKVIFLKLD